MSIVWYCLSLQFSTPLHMCENRGEKSHTSIRQKKERNIEGLSSHSNQVEVTFSMIEFYRWITQKLFFRQNYTFEYHGQWLYI